MEKINVQQLSKAIAGFQQCKEGYKEVHQDKIEELCKLLPSGSGIDSGVKLQIIPYKLTRQTTKNTFAV